MMFGRTRKERSPTLRRRFWKRKRILIPAVIILLLAVWYWRVERRANLPSLTTTFVVRHGDLDISVTEGGSVEALESQTIKSQIKGQTKILTIVDEGDLVTEDDVKNKKVLVTLDDSDLIEKLTQEEFEYQSALANYTDAREQYEIQIKQNDSDIKTAELDVRFAAMDFEKYLGTELAATIIKQRGLAVNDVMERLTRETGEGLAKSAQAEAKKDLGGGDTPADPPSDAPTPAAKPPDAKPPGVTNSEPKTPASPEPDDSAGPSVVASNLPRVNFSQYASPEKLGDGQAQQTLRKLQSDRLLAEEALGLAETQFAGTQRLAEKKFVTQQDLDNDEMRVKQNTVTRDSAITAEDLFVRYEFPKAAEQFLSTYEESIRKLERTKRQAIAKEAQALARKNSSEASFKLHERRRRELNEQIAACTIVAERQGLVVYAGSDNPWRGQDRIEPGAQIREFQEIITIPDMAQMAVKVKVHESAIKQIQRGQKAAIKLDAYPDEELHGEVVRISVLPDSGQRWMNPDTKVYPCTVSINGAFDWLKPSMTAQVEIQVKQLKDVVYVPIQAVFPEGSKRVCYTVDALGRSTRRVVETGEMNGEFIEIKSGLKEGERVLLRAPAGASGERAQTDTEGKGKGQGKDRPQQPQNGERPKAN